MTDLTTVEAKYRPIHETEFRTLRLEMDDTTDVVMDWVEELLPDCAEVLWTRVVEDG